MCEENKNLSNCEEAGHDCSQCKGSDGNGHCSHSHQSGEPQERTIKDYLELTYKQNQVIAVKLEAYSKELRKAGMDEVANQLQNAIPEFEKGNMWISLAKSML